MATAGQHLAASVLAALPNTALFEPTIDGRRDSTPLLYRRAKAFIDDNAQRNIALTDIARRLSLDPWTDPGEVWGGWFLLLVLGVGSL